MADRCHTLGMDSVRQMDRLPNRTAVLFVLHLDLVTGSNLPSLCRGLVLGPALPACAGLTLVPVMTVKPDGEWVALYIGAGDILETGPVL